MSNLRTITSITACIVITAMLAACQTFTPAQVRSMSNTDLCYVSTKIHGAETESVINGEIRRRKADCTPAHLACADYGFTKGTKEYASCRMEQQHIALEQARTENEYRQQHDLLKQTQQSINEDEARRNNQTRCHTECDSRYSTCDTVCR